VLSLLVSVILDQIQMERDGDTIDKALIKSCSYMLEELYLTNDERPDEKLYLTSFEPAFLEASRNFYRAEGEKMLRDSDAGTYLRHTSRRLVEEADRCGSTISLLTEQKIRTVVEDELIVQNAKEVLEMEGSGIKHMLDNDRFEELGLVYDLIYRVNHRKEELRKALQKHIEDSGPPMVKLLLEKGADLESIRGQTPLSWAAERGYEAVVKLLLEKGADLESKDIRGQTPLSRAAERGYEAVVKLLLERGADLESKDDNGRTPLFWAVAKGHKAVVKLLLEKGADLESKDKYGQTPLIVGKRASDDRNVEF
jgi:Cullin family/Ankyrin repeats (3 copies)/Ankyrin repeats (many copies)